MDSVVPNGFFLSIAAGSDRPHQFCGPHQIGGAVCPTCKKGLLLLLWLNARDPAVSGLGRDIPLLCCWTCNAIQDVYSYRLDGESAISLLAWRRGGSQKDFPYGSYPSFFPAGSASLIPLTDQEQGLLVEINRGRVKTSSGEARRLSEPQHQVGGEPFFVQREPAALKCPECQRTMPFLAAIADSNLDPRGFVGNKFVQVIFHYCVDCGIVSGYQQSE